jgi:glycerol uptake facilitator
MNPFFAELLGTAILIVFGNGVVANVALEKTKGHGSGWIVITFGWGMAVFIAVFCVQDFSGAHLNPAVTIGLAAAGRFSNGFSWSSVPVYILGQMVGAFVGATLVYLFYREHFNLTEDGDAKRACFCTSPNVRSFPSAFLCEVIGTFLLLLPVLLMVDPKLSLGTDPDHPVHGKVGLGALGALPVGLLVFGIGLSLGGTTGYAINPARDLSPRLAHFLLPIWKKGNSDWIYAWIPVLGPIVGGLLAALVVRFLELA